MKSEETLSASIKDKMAEAMLRMDKLQFNQAFMDKFTDSEEVTYVDSLTGDYHGLTEDQKAFKKKFEENGKNLVYFVIGSIMMGMRLESYIFVSDYPDEWDFDHADIDNGYLMTYTRNLARPENSEYGSIVFTHHPNGFPVLVPTPAMTLIVEGDNEDDDPIVESLAMIHSKKEPEMVQIIMQTGKNDYIVKTKDGIYCHALFNPFVRIYYADDLYRKVEEKDLYAQHFDESNDPDLYGADIKDGCE